jgi:HEAT repeat protein
MLASIQTLLSPRRSLRTLGASLLFIFALSALTSACDSGPKPGEEAVYWGAKLNSDKVDFANREVALAKLNELKDPKALPHLYDALKLTGRSIELRPKVVELIGVTGDDTSVQPLVDAVDWGAGASRDKETRFLANANEKIAKALGKLGKGDDAKVVDTLKRLADNNNQDVQLAAVVALGDLKAEGAVEKLVELADGHPNNFMVRNAVEALGKIADPRAARVLGKLLFFERQGVSFYREASYALFLIGKGAMPVLDEIYGNKFKDIEDLHIEPNVQKTKAIVVYGDLAIPETFKRIIDGVDTSGNDTATALLRIESQRAAGRLGLKDAVRGLKNRMDNVDVSQSEHALAALAQIGVRDVADDIYSMATSAGFLKNCTKQGNGEDECRFSEVQIRRPRVLAWSLLASDAGKLDAMLKDEKNADFKKLMTDVGARVQAGAECGTKLECWKGKLKDPSPRVRERAAYELAWMNNDQARDALFDALTDEDNEVRYAAIIGVGRRLPKDAQGVADRLQAQLTTEKGKTQYIRINEDLKRLEVRVRRGY